VRQQILRLVVKEVLVGTDTITLRHSIPIPPGSNGSPSPPPTSLDQGRTQVIFCVRGVVSPLLSNLYLNEVDQMLEKAKEVTRYERWTAVE